MFPEFATASDESDSETYHQVVVDLAPHLKGYLDRRSEGEVRAFAELINRMVGAGGDLRNAIETGLLEHATQVGCAQLLKPYLSKQARMELR
jgi:hypothetical protein